jgi:SAM-dependent methyltransferase
MSVFTTEITSDKLASDNPIHQRLLKAYLLAKPFVKGDLLELGCGEGRGVSELAPLANSYRAIDKIKSVVDQLSDTYPQYEFISGKFPPFPYETNSFDVIVSFQVIEHVGEDEEFVKEIHRVLKPGGVALLTTPNILMTLTRNPWHIREYTSEQLKDLCSRFFDHVEMRGVKGNDKVMTYYEKNKASVEKITRFDFLNLQYRLPASILRIPYDLLNRFNRVSLKKGSDELVASITTDDYLEASEADDNLDLFVILRKNDA